MTHIKISAPGKVIISGEHSVVYGYPAIVAAVDRRLTVNEKYQVESKIPIGCGMGSSAAYAVAVSAIRCKIKKQKINKELINKEAYQMERAQHGNASGVDNTICTYGGFLWYRKEAEGLKLYSSIVSKRKLANLFLINTGKPVESTRQMVTQVAKSLTRNKSKYRGLLNDLGETTKAFLRHILGEEKSSLGELIKKNEQLLEKLGIVSETTKELINRIEKMGGFAKVTGAGGLIDKSGVLLVYTEKPNTLQNFGKKENLNLFRVKLGVEGVRID